MFKNIWLWITGSLVGFLTIFKALFVRRIRISKEMASTLYDHLRERGRAFVIDGEAVQDKIPVLYDALCALDGVLFRFVIAERMLRAGFSGTDSVATLTTFRWQIKRLVTLGTVKREDVDSISVHLLRPWDAERIGKLKIPKQLSIPYLEHSIYAPFESSIREVLGDARDRTSALIYGPPGNGKSYLARYLAFKYRLPIYIVSLIPDTSNHDLIRMFGQRLGRRISRVLLLGQ